jgi:hypothetical protein
LGLFALRQSDAADIVCVNVPVVNVTLVPGGPEVGAKVIVVWAYAGVGIRIAETEKSRPDASRSTRCRELTRRVINSRHATDVLVGLGYLMLHV